MKIDLRHLLPLALVLALGIVIGRYGLPGNVAHAEPRPSPPREAFQSGAARSEGLLREIASTLKRIESRVSRIESKLPTTK